MKSMTLLLWSNLKMLHELLTQTMRFNVLSTQISIFLNFIILIVVNNCIVEMLTMSLVDLLHAIG